MFRNLFSRFGWVVGATAVVALVGCGQKPVGNFAEGAPGAAEPMSRVAMQDSGATSVDPDIVAEKHIIKTANLTVRVDNVVDAADRAKAIAKNMEGFTANTTILADQQTRPSANLVLRVPAHLFDAAVAELLGLGETVRNTQTSEDVSADVADLDARLRVMRAEEESLITILRQATKIGDVLAVKERLSQVRQDIEGTEARVKSLRRQAAMSTIYVDFVQTPAVGVPGVTQDWAGKAWANSVNALTGFGVTLGQIAIMLFVFSPVWVLPLLLLVIWSRRAAKKRSVPPSRLEGV